MDRDIRLIAENTPEDIYLSPLAEFNMGAAGTPAPQAAATQIQDQGPTPEEEMEKTVDQIKSQVWNTIGDLKQYHDKHKTSATQIAYEKAMELHTLLDEIDGHLKNPGITR